jgi:hypothetical protein
MAEIPTAEQVVTSWMKRVSENIKVEKQEPDSLEKMMIEFAKMHVEAALKVASERAEISWENDIIKNAYQDTTCVDENSILNSYSLDDIK